LSIFIKIVFDAYNEATGNAVFFFLNNIEIYNSVF